MEEEIEKSTGEIFHVHPPVLADDDHDHVQPNIPAVRPPAAPLADVQPPISQWQLNIPAPVPQLQLPQPSFPTATFSLLNELVATDEDEVKELLKKVKLNKKKKAVPEKELQKLHVAAMKGNWDGTTAKLLRENEKAKTEILSNMGMTAVHVAASCGRSEFVKKMVELLDADQLEARDQVGRTALHYVALAADMSAAKAMVTKNSRLPMLGDMNSYTPLFYAAKWRHSSKSREMLKYLVSVTQDIGPCHAYTAPSAITLIVGITASGSHDTALDVLRKYPELALKSDDNGMTVLHSLAMQPSAFDCSNELSLMEKLIHPWKNQQLGRQKKQYKDALKLVDFICQELLKETQLYVLQHFFPSQADSKAILHLATEHGVLELIKACLEYFPDLIWYVDNDKKLLLHVALEHRREKIFNNVINLIGENTKAYADTEADEDGNNILHLAAKLAPTAQLFSVPGPAFQMQRELQWYQAVEKLVYNEKRVATNINKKTPRELFFESHKDLIKEAKDWMKDISNSCMLVATLVATVAFAAMITVPGGNDTGGKPVLSKKKLFLVFSISDAVSMISSAVALLMFLSIQTSRYTEEDFLQLLPETLLKGLASLFVAVATMMIAFGTAIGLALQTRVNWAYIPITIAASFPVIIFTWLQLPLLLQTLVFTAGPGIFDDERLSDHRQSKLGFLYKIITKVVFFCRKPFAADSTTTDHHHDHDHVA